MTRCLFLAASLAFCMSLGAAAAAAINHFDNPGAFAQELRRLAAEAGRDGSSGIAAELPAQWQVDTQQGAFNISTEPLRRGDARKQREWLAYLAEEMDSYASATRSSSEPTNARNQLDRILRDPEFSRFEEQKTWIERLEERAGAWIIKQLDKILRLAAQHPTTSQVLFWTALCGGVAFLAWRLFLLWNQPQAAFQLSAPLNGSESKSEEQWIAAARTAASAGDLDRAIQCAYWAGVVRLQDTGRLSKKLNLTPREYLKTVAGLEVAGPLRSLTVSLEQFWYARSPATAENLAGCFRSLEALGCKVS